jgi:uncharacterized protein (TIGR03083 family)
MPLMQRDEYLDAITTESAALAEAAERAGLDAAVPSCPGWTIADLVGHIGNVQRWARITVEQRATERIQWRSLPPPPPAAEILEWFRAQTPALIATLAATDPATPVWSWTGDHTAGFWSRRQANEVVVHRWDAQLAAGIPSEIDAVLAADGVDECLGMAAVRNRELLTGDGETVHLHCTDISTGIGPGTGGGGEWLVALTVDGPVIERVHAKGDVAARGTASNLDLFVWGRVPVADLEVFGDVALLERFQAATQA